MDPLRVACAVLLLGGCHMDPVPGSVLGPQTSPTPLYPLPTDPPVGVAVPGPPPAPQRDGTPTCDDSQVAVPGQWEWIGEWTWCSGYCALAQAGYAYVAPQYQNGLYVRAHFAQIEGQAVAAGLKVPYRRYVHPPEFELGPKAPPAPPPVVVQQAPSPPIYYGYGGRPIPWPPRPWPRPDPGTGERPGRPPAGLGERP